MSVKQADLSRAWGCSRALVSQYVKNGMPVSSAEEAAAWRLAHHPGSALRNRQGGVDRVASSNHKGADLPEIPDPVKPSDLAREDIEGTLSRLKKSELVAWVELAKSVKMQESTRILSAQKRFADAATARVRLEKEVDELRLQRREIVFLSEAKELFGRHLQSLRMTLRNLPSRLAARCNPMDPDLAKETLHEAVSSLFKTMNGWNL